VARSSADTRSGGFAVQLVHVLVSQLTTKYLSGSGLRDDVDKLDAAGKMLVVDGAFVDELLDVVSGDAGALPDDDVSARCFAESETIRFFIEGSNNAVPLKML